MSSGIEILPLGATGLISTLRSVLLTGLTRLKTDRIVETGMLAQVMFPPKQVQGDQSSPLGQNEFRGRNRKSAMFETFEAPPSLSMLLIATKYVTFDSALVTFNEKNCMNPGSTDGSMVPLTAWVMLTTLGFGFSKLAPLRSSNLVEYLISYRVTRQFQCQA